MPTDFARAIFDGQTVRGSDAHALENAVGQDRQWLPVRGREQEDKPDVAPVGSRRHLHPPHGIAKLRPGNNIGIDAHGPHAQFGYDAIHRFEAVERLSLPGGGKAVRTHAVEPAPFAEFDVSVFEDLHAIGHGEDLLNIIIGEDQGHEGRTTEDGGRRTE